MKAKSVDERILIARGETDFRFGDDTSSCDARILPKLKLNLS